MTLMALFAMLFIGNVDQDGKSGHSDRKGFANRTAVGLRLERRLPQ
jgi:hypothetical protein